MRTQHLKLHACMASVPLIAIMLAALCVDQGLAGQSTATSQAQPAADSILTNKNILEMIKIGLSPDIIVAKINNSKSDFDTSIAAVKDMKDAGVPVPVLLAMVNAPKREFDQAKASSSIPPLERLLSAKIVYLVAQSKDHNVFDNFDKKLKEWGRWEVAQMQKDAVLLLVFSDQQTFYGSMQSGTVVMNPAGTFGTGIGSSFPIFSDQRFLMAVDPTTGVNKLLL